MPYIWGAILIYGGMSDTILAYITMAVWTGVLIDYNHRNDAYKELFFDIVFVISIAFINLILIIRDILYFVFDSMKMGVKYLWGQIVLIHDKLIFFISSIFGARDLTDEEMKYLNTILLYSETSEFLKVNNKYNTNINMLLYSKTT